MRTINPASFLSLLKPTKSVHTSSLSSPTTPTSAASSIPPSPTTSTGSSSSDFENDTPPVSPVRSTTLVVPLATVVATRSTRPPLRRRFGLASTSSRAAKDESNSADEEDEADGQGRVVSFLGHAGQDKDGRMNSFGSVGSCGGNGAKRRGGGGGGGGRSVGGGGSRRGSFNPASTLTLSPSIGTSFPLTLDFSSLPPFVAPAPNNSPVEGVLSPSVPPSSSDPLGLLWSNQAASITSITIEHFANPSSSATAANSPGGSRVATPSGLPSHRKRPSVCFSLVFDNNATLAEDDDATSPAAALPSPPLPPLTPPVFNLVLPDRNLLFSPSVHLAPRILPSLSQTMDLLAPSPLDLPSPLHLETTPKSRNKASFDVPESSPPIDLDLALPSCISSSPRPPTKAFFSPPPNLPPTPPLTVARRSSNPRPIGRRRSSVFKLKTDCPTPPSLLESPRMGWRREFQAGFGGSGCGKTPASTPLGGTGGVGGYRRAEGGGGAETRRVWGEFWGVKFEENEKGDGGEERVLTPYSFAADDLAEKLGSLGEGGVGVGEKENPYFVGAVVA